MPDTISIPASRVAMVDEEKKCAVVWYRFFDRIFKQVSPPTTAPEGITVTASPFSYTNSTTTNIDVIVYGGTVSSIKFSRDRSALYLLGQTSGMFRLSPLDMLTVVYSVKPTMTLVMR